MLWYAGNTAPFYITQPSIDDNVQIVSTTMTMVTVTCSLNITIPSNMRIAWAHNNSIMSVDGVSRSDNTTTLLIRSFQPSDIGDYQCIFIDVDSGWTLRRDIRLFINGMLNVLDISIMKNSLKITATISIDKILLYNTRTFCCYFQAIKSVYFTICVM